MFSKAHYPDILLPEDLDLYLADGWFRWGQSIFTTSYLNFNSQFYRAIWLRVVLSELNDDKIYKKLQKINARFRVEIQKASVTSEKEELFQVYKKGISFKVSESLEALLFGTDTKRIYDTREVCIYDDDKLIACGFFDMGKDSAAGINSFYNHEYKKYSLGRYIIYSKMMYCKSLGLQYFYPGYFAPGYPAFDYKLDIGKVALEYYDLAGEQWLHINTFDPVAGSVSEMKEKLTTLVGYLNEADVEARLLNYRYFDANLVADFNGYNLFDYPMFVYCLEFVPEVINPVIVYDFRDQHYHLIRNMSVGMVDKLEDQSVEYSAHLMKPRQVLFSSDNPEIMANMISSAFKSTVKAGR
jgi:arginyl-tRNA--protein-N-Asp/Glu arginylyltransferase